VSDNISRFLSCLYDIFYLQLITCKEIPGEIAMKKSWLELEQSTRHEVIATIGVILTLGLCLSLGSYYPGDTAIPGMSASTTDIGVKNLIGKPGAIVAAVLITLLGRSSWALPMVLFFFSLRGFRRTHHPNIMMHALSGALLLLSFPALLALIARDLKGGEVAMYIGGITGTYLSDKLHFFGPVGAYMILITVALMGLVLTTNIGPWSMLRHGGGQVGRAWQARPRPRLGWLNSESQEDDYEPEPEPESAWQDEEEIILRVDSFQPNSGFPEYDNEPLVIDEETAELEIKTNGGRICDQTPQEPETAIDSSGIEIVTDMEEIKASRRRRKPGKERPESISGAEYQMPGLDLLNLPAASGVEIYRDEIENNSAVLQQTLQEFGITARVVAVSCGPVITRYEMELAAGVKISRVTGLSDNIALSLKATRVRIIAPIPGKGTVGIEVPNKKRADVLIREVLDSETYLEEPSLLRIALGKSISGKTAVADLTKMPHLLIAGATGTGKSVCINSVICSILYNATPEQVKFLMIDPKRVELKLYSDIPHLLHPVITDNRQAGAALEWLVEEMEQRYGYLSKAGCRDLKGYNKKRYLEMTNIQSGELETDTDFDLLPAHLPYIVLVIDELADLMAVARAEVETMIIRLAQMSRAVGIHLVMATQRPSVNVITGLIKANFPSRIAFRVASKVDSRTILDENGAETLLGMGDMLFTRPGGDGPVRLQGCLISTEEAERVSEACKAKCVPQYLDMNLSVEEAGGGKDGAVDPYQEDELYGQAVTVVMDNGAASTSLLQRRLKVGYGRAARLLDLMEEEGLIGPSRGSKAREILVGS
jgi:DNA segregation ATPase FtsK/SpoIIIE, S-DNA-T family